MPKVLLVDPFLANELEHFRPLLPEDVALAVCTTYEDAEFAQLAVDADVLVNTLRSIDAAALAMAPRARFVQQFGAGYDPIDVAAVNARNVLVAYNPGVNAAGRGRAHLVADARPGQEPSLERALGPARPIHAGRNARLGDR